ncbi:MAG: RagB/SusD family nutrient uptake outer membrane protein [Muribaculaceae bacterium]|nr:RagB/SusD family nutrient uptake outer membrane protein [Muribaculaceae bacterium]
MKKYIIYSILGSMALTTLTGCYDLQTEPKDQYVTEEQKNQVKVDNPNMTLASVTGITAIFSTFQQVVENHIDYGIPSVMLMLDSRGMDMISEDSGYNWYSTNAEMSDCSPSSYLSRLGWEHYYRQIYACNDLLNVIDKETEDPEFQFYLAQSYAMRANAYFNLAQIFQFTYVGNESKRGVMLITEENTEEATVNGCQRSTVEKTYELIVSDINKAIQLLEACELGPEKILSSKPKRFVSLATAYGLRARINLVMNKWADAADDAKAAIKAFKGKPMSQETASHPGLNSLEESNWMWGIAIAETDRVVTSGIINWPSHMGSLCYGYASVGSWRKCNIDLYNSIPQTDVRRNWFLDSDGVSQGLSQAQQEFCTASGIPAFTQVKFAPYNGELDTSTNANDIPLMRIEEMYYILAEATAMSGGDGASILSAFVQEYRDPAYKFSGSGVNVQDECWRQRRIELWGEGLTTFDLLRLKKPIDRRGGGWEPNWVYYIDPTDNVLIIPLPQSEINGNPAINESDNNPAAPMPTPVADYE